MRNHPDEASPDRIRRLEAELAASKRAQAEVERENRRLHEIQSHHRDVCDRLAALADTARHLEETPSEDDLCREAVLWGRRRLGYGRMGIWFYDGDEHIIGSYGVDERGELRDERDCKLHIPVGSGMGHVLIEGRENWLASDADLFDDEARKIGRGDHAITAMRHGTQRIGALSCDTLLGPARFDDWDVRILSLFATSIAHLWVGRQTARMPNDPDRTPEQNEAAQRIAERALTGHNQIARLGEMSASLAHELHQPLTAIANYGEGCLRRLDRGNFDQSEFTHAIRSIVSQTGRANMLIDRIREFLQDRPAHRASVDPNDVVRNAARTCSDDLDKGRTRLELALCDQALSAQVDPLQIEQVLINLICNGIEAMGSNGNGSRRDDDRQLRIETMPAESDSAQIRVRDNGEGVDTKTASQLFDPFYTSKSEGMGLGLTICRKIVTSHGGRLWWEPNEPAGSTFVFTLPLSP